MKNVLLITQGFPYGISELGFLPTEYAKLMKSCRLSILSFDTVNEPAFELSKDVHYYRYTWSSSVSPISALLQLRHKEVLSDAALLLSERQNSILPNFIRILFFSRRAEQVEKQLAQIIEADKIDIVYTYWCVQATIAALRLKRRFPRLKVITRMHGMDLYEEQISNGWQVMKPYIARNCNKLIFISKDGMSYFMSHWGKEWAEKSEVIHIGCRAMPRCMLNEAADKPLVLVSCSSIIPIKRVALIADALAALDSGIRVDWHHFGGGELSFKLAEHADDVLGSKKNISYKLHGAIPNSELPKAYSDTGAQLFITTSETEGIPVSIMEAFAMGIPAVGTAVGGIPEIIEDGVTGFLMPSNPTAKEAAGAITRYASMDITQRNAMSQNAYDCWQRAFNAEHGAERITDLLDEIAFDEAVK